MAVLNIEGQRVNVDDGFLKLSPEQQSATVDEIAGKLRAGKGDAAAGASASTEPAQKSGGMHDEVMQLLKGVPIAGAYAEKAAAGLQAAVNPLTGDGDAGETFGARYDKNLARETARSSAYEREHPYMSTALNVGGGVAATAPLMAARPLAWALGGAGPMAARIPLGAASGAGIGVADALARGNDPTIGGAIGAGAGAAGPVIGKAIGAGFNRVADALISKPDEIAGLSRGARNALLDTSSPNTPARLGELGPDAMLFEGNPATMQLAQGMVAARPGAAQAKIVNAVTDRDAGATARLKTDVEKNFGPYQEPGQLEQRLDEAIDQASKKYASVAGAGQQGLDVKPIIAKLDEKIATEAGMSKEALQKARGYFYGPARDVMPDGTRVYGKSVTVTPPPAPAPPKNEQQRLIEQVFGPSAAPPGKGAPAPGPTVKVETVPDKLKTEIYDLHNVRIALDQLHGTLGETPKAQALIGGLRKDLDQLMPQNMKDVDRVVADLYRQKEALGVGQSKILRTGPEAMTEKGLQNFQTSGGHAGGPISPGQADMLKAGTRADIERMVGTNANDVAALRKMVGGEGDWNRAKLAQIFGPDEADKVINSVDREVAFKDAVNKLVTNSQTAQRARAAQYVDKSVGENGGEPIPAFWTRLGQLPEMALRKGGGFIRDELAGNARVKADEGLADVLTKMGPERDRVVQALIDYAGRRGQAAPISAGADRIAQLLAVNSGLEVPRAAQR